MTEVGVYLFARRLVGEDRGAMWVRRIRIEEAIPTPAGGSYTVGQVILDADVRCDPKDPNTDQFFVIAGEIAERG